MKPHEALLPHTEALSSATGEIRRYNGKWLVRFRWHDGAVTRRTFPHNQLDNAFALFLEWSDRLRREAQQRRNPRESHP